MHAKEMTITSETTWLTNLILILMILFIVYIQVEILWKKGMALFRIRRKELNSLLNYSLSWVVWDRLQRSQQDAVVWSQPIRVSHLQHGASIQNRFSGGSSSLKYDRQQSTSSNIQQRLSGAYWRKFTRKDVVHYIADLWHPYCCVARRLLVRRLQFRINGAIFQSSAWDIGAIKLPGTGCSSDISRWKYSVEFFRHTCLSQSLYICGNAKGSTLVEWAHLRNAAETLSLKKTKPIYASEIT